MPGMDKRQAFEWRGILTVDQKVRKTWDDLGGKPPKQIFDISLPMVIGGQVQSPRNSYVHRVHDCNSHAQVGLSTHVGVAVWTMHVSCSADGGGRGGGWAYVGMGEN